MACIGSSRLCARAEKLCQFGHFAQARRKISTTYSRARPEIERPVNSFVQHCQQNKALTTERRTGATRTISSLQTTLPGSLHDQIPSQVDPYRLVEDDLKLVFEGIHTEVTRNTIIDELKTITTYYFDGKGKALRPMLTILMARAVNYHVKGRDYLLPSQRKVAMFAEMVHGASLMQDDVIDNSTYRRGKPSVNVVWNQKQVTVAGDYILGVASMIVARLGNDEVTITLSQILTDLVFGEIMQLESKRKDSENERFAHYLSKTYRKTASLIANMLKAVAMLADADEDVMELVYQYGRNVGLAFQLVDDFLDFTPSNVMGKPTIADLKVGLATAPVLFACEEFPELDAMILRQFQHPNDVERAFELVHKSQGLAQTKFMAKKHCAEEVGLVQSLAESPFQKALVTIGDLVLNRIK